MLPVKRVIASATRSSAVASASSRRYLSVWLPHLPADRILRTRLRRIGAAPLSDSSKNGKAERRIYRTVGYGSSFGGNPLRQHIGIGPSTEIERIEITWPVSKSTQRFTHVAADQVLHVLEGTAAFVPVHPRTFTLAPSSPAHMHTMASPQ